ncbi:MAG: RecX family transcriptional regulator [Actinomycetota bacterium]|nr:RecX family transcriptional regulator [Actinomycetota bacterium]
MRASLAELTGLRRERPGRVVLEVDGRRWRTVSDGVVVRAGLSVGMKLERPVLRTLRRELQRAEALSLAGRALARRDLSRRRLAARLEQAGVASKTAHMTVEGLGEAGLVDDVRVASARAARLSERGWGDAAIIARLEGEGIEAGLASETVRTLPPERGRAQALVDPQGDVRRTVQMLGRRGFSPETLEDVAGALDAEHSGGLR